MAFLFDRVSLWRNAPLASLQRNVLVPRPWRGGKYRTYLASSTKSSHPASHPPSPRVSLSLSHPHWCPHTRHTHTLPLFHVCSVQGAGTGIFVYITLFSNKNPPVCLLMGSCYRNIPNQMLPNQVSTEEPGQQPEMQTSA